MTFTWGQIVILAVGALAFCCFVFGMALIAVDDIFDPDAGSQFDDTEEDTDAA